MDHAEFVLLPAQCEPVQHPDELTVGPIDLDAGLVHDVDVALPVYGQVVYLLKELGAFARPSERADVRTLFGEFLAAVVLKISGRLRRFER